MNLGANEPLYQDFTLGAAAAWDKVWGTHYAADLWAEQSGYALGGREHQAAVASEPEALTTAAAMTDEQIAAWFKKKAEQASDVFPFWVKAVLVVGVVGFAVMQLNTFSAPARKLADRTVDRWMPGRR